MDLFTPRNLDLHEDGSVTPHDFGKDVQHKDNESLSEYADRYNKSLSDLEDYEYNKVIPEFQKEELWNVRVYKEPTHKTIEEDQRVFNSDLMYEKWFLERENAIRFAKNKIKQQSIGYYYSKENPHRRQYAFFYIIIHKGEMETAKAINGKII